MKAYKLVLLHFLFFVLMFLATHLLKEQLFIKRACYVIFIIGLTYLIFSYLSNSANLAKGFVVNLVILFIFFEIMKATEYLLDLMPKYSEEILVSMVGSFIGLALYLGFIVLVCRLIKVLSRKKANS